MSRSCRAPATCGPPRRPGSSVPAPAGGTGAWELPEELVMLRDTVRRFMDAHVHPTEEKLDHDAIGLPREQLVELQAKARALGLWALQTPEEYGGAGLSVLGQVVVAEEAAKCRMGAFFPALGAFGGNPPSVMFSATRELFDRQRHDLVELHCAVARQPLVLRRNFSGLVGELPRRIGKNGRETAALCEADQIERCSGLCRRR